MRNNIHKANYSEYVTDNNCVLMKGNDIVRSYGSIYNSTGGGERIDKFYKFVYKFVDNRVLELYLKYLGITTLTPTTLVPIALIYGQESFSKFLKKMKSRTQRGGKIPVIDNKLLGTYLTVAGLTKLSLTANTLVPLGLAMAIYKVFRKNQKKGQSGGNIGQLLGQSVPPGYLQLGRSYWNGERIQNNLTSPLTGFQQLSRPNDFINHELQTLGVGVPSSAHIGKVGPGIPIIQVAVDGIPNTSTATQGSGILVDGIRPLNTEAPASYSNMYEDVGANAWGVFKDGMDLNSVVLRNAMA